MRIARMKDKTPREIAGYFGLSMENTLMLQELIDIKISDWIDEFLISYMENINSDN